jgi:integral membrane protein (TIGR01906 family)
MPNFIPKLLRILLISLIPVILILGSARLLATDSFLTFEYSKASFPPDPYGFTPQQRFILASTNIHYVRAHLPEDELSKQTLNGVAVYNEREVTHMADVQAVFQIILRIWQAAFILLLLLAVIFLQNGKQEAFASAIQWGGLVTAGMILAIALLAIFAWQAWFDLFHRFLFVPGSWLFSYTDTLIRLFPIKFWFDATLTISVLAFVAGILLAFIGWRGKTLMARQPVDVMQVA